MKEASQEDALASSRHFFAPGNGQSRVVPLGLPEEVPITTADGIPLAYFHTCYCFHNSYYLHYHNNHCS